MRPKPGPTTLVAVLLLALLTTVPAAGQQGAIAGTVTDGGTGQPLPDVQVQVLGAGGPGGSVTNRQGGFRVPVGAGTYTVVATMIGFEERRVEGVQVAAGQTATVG